MLNGNDYPPYEFSYGRKPHQQIMVLADDVIRMSAFPAMMAEAAMIGKPDACKESAGDNADAIMAAIGAGLGLYISVEARRRGITSGHMVRVLSDSIYHAIEYCSTVPQREGE
jgi:hypothetical protein